MIIVFSILCLLSILAAIILCHFGRNKKLEKKKRIILLMISIACVFISMVFITLLQRAAFSTQI